NAPEPPLICIRACTARTASGSARRPAPSGASHALTIVRIDAPFNAECHTIGASRPALTSSEAGVKIVMEAGVDSIYHHFVQALSCHGSAQAAIDGKGRHVEWANASRPEVRSWEDFAVGAVLPIQCTMPVARWARWHRRADSARSAGT